MSANVRHDGKVTPEGRVKHAWLFTDHYGLIDIVTRTAPTEHTWGAGGNYAWPSEIYGRRTVRFDGGAVFGDGTLLDYGNLFSDQIPEAFTVITRFKTNSLTVAGDNVICILHSSTDANNVAFGVLRQGTNCEIYIKDSDANLFESRVVGQLTDDSMFTAVGTKVGTDYNFYLRRDLTGEEWDATVDASSATGFVGVDRFSIGGAYYPSLGLSGFGWTGHIESIQYLDGSVDATEGYELIRFPYKYLRAEGLFDGGGVSRTTGRVMGMPAQNFWAPFEESEPKSSTPKRSTRDRLAELVGTLGMPKK